MSDSEYWRSRLCVRDKELAAANQRIVELEQKLSTKCNCELVDQMVVPCAWHQGIEDDLNATIAKLTQALSDARNEFARSDMVHDCYYAPQTSGTQIREWEELIKQNNRGESHE